MATSLLQPLYSGPEKSCQSFCYLKSSFCTTTLSVGPDFAGLLFTKLKGFYCMLPSNLDITVHCNTHLQPFVSCTIKFTCLKRYTPVHVFQLLLNSFSKCNVPSTYSLRIDCANGFKNVGKWGFPFQTKAQQKDDCLD